jgi:spermidine/putrescine-binding protein
MSKELLSAAAGRRAVLGGIAGVAGAAATGWPPPARAATDLVWLGWQGYEGCLKAGSFLQDHDLALSTTFINANEDILAKFQAGGADQTDLITIYFGYVPILAEAGYLAPIDDSLPGIVDILPELTANQALRHEGKLYGVPFTWGSLQMMYDPAVVTTTPASWRECLKPEHKGKVLMINDPVGIVSIWAPIVTGVPVPTRITADQLRQTIDFPIDMKRNQARSMATSFGEGADMFARNEVVISAIGWEAMVGFAAAKGKKIAMTVPEEGTQMFVDCLCIPSGAPHPEQAAEAVSACLAPKGQLAIANELDQAIVNHAAVPELDAENRATYRYDDFAELTKKARLYPFFPLEREGEFVTYDDMLQEYERLLKA